MGYSPIVQDDKDEDIYTLSKKLFDLAVHAEWDKIVEIYEKDPNAHTTKITKSGDTALHLAVQDGKEEVVMKLVDSIRSHHPDKWIEVLGLKNDRGDTPLHFAASMGNLPMCYELAHSKPELIGLRNDEGEAPLFVAASNGEKKAFLCPHSLIPEAGRIKTGLSYSRRRDGDTFLHCALDGDYFDLAFQIILLYGELGNCLNVDGNSPLHLLANKPSAFKSGSRLGFIDKIMYHCTFVNRLKEVENLDGICKCLTPPTEKEATYPENYLVCAHFFFVLKKVCTHFFFNLKNVCVDFYDFFPELFESLGRRRSTAAGRATDTESQVPVPQTNQVAVPAPQTKTVSAPQTNQVLPPNYDVIFDFFKLHSKAMFIILGLGHTKIEKIKEKKEKHIWSVQIMEKLLEKYTYYQYEQDAQESVDEHSNKDGGTEPYVCDPEELGEAESSSSKRTRREEKYLEVNRETPISLPVNTETPILLAAKNGITEMVKSILEKLEVESSSSKRTRSNKGETPILVAAKNGITEMVESILKKFPVAINDVNEHKKNIVLLAVEHGQVEVYKLLLSLFKKNDRVFRTVDREGNSALHIAASGGHIPWLAPGAALQLHERYMWYEFVKRSKWRGFFPKYNKYWKTALEVLNETNKNRIEDANKWMSDASQSCSVVAVLVATIAYTTSATIPGGFNGGDSGGRDSGLPVLGGHAMFDVFSISGDVAFVLSTMALVLFLPVFSSYNQVSHFRTAAPAKLLVGLTLLLLSLTAIMVSFSAAESFIVVNGNRKFMKFIIFAATCFPIILVANQFPLYFRIFKSIVKNAFA